MSRRRTQFGESAMMNTLSYIIYFDRLKELAISMFEWQNLPDSVDERFLELTLFERGNCLFFKDDVLDFLTLPNAQAGGFDVYRNPLTRRAYAVNGYNKELNEDNSVIIWNNYLRQPSLPTVNNYARMIWDLDRSIMVNAKAQKTPIIVLCDENQRLSMINFYKEYDGNQPYIFADSSMNLENIKAVSTEAPYVADKLYTLKTQYWNEALTYLGISNLNIQKKERLVSDEVTRNMGGTIASRYSRLEMRRQAADQINKMFGLNISVDYREDFREQDDEFMLEEDENGKTAKEMVIDLRTRSGAENSGQGANPGGR